MKYFYFSIQHSLRMFLINKKIVFTEKDIVYNLIEKMSCKKFKNTKTNETMFETRSDKSTYAKVFLELPLTI